MSKTEDREKLRTMQRERMAAKNSGQTDEAKARERIVAVAAPKKANDHESKLQAGVGSERSSPETKLGRPRLGEQRAKPWLHTKPPMSKTTWYRRQAEKRGSSE